MGDVIDLLVGLCFLLLALSQTWGWYRARRARRQAVPATLRRAAAEREVRHGIVALLSFALAAVDLVLATRAAIPH